MILSVHRKKKKKRWGGCSTFTSCGCGGGYFDQEVSVLTLTDVG